MKKKNKPTEANSENIQPEKIDIDSIPLIEMMQPQNLDEYLGQARILGETSWLRASILDDNIPNIIFLGSPGCGKTSLANIIKNFSKKHFVSINAMVNKIKDIDALLADIKARNEETGNKTILFVDELGWLKPEWRHSISAAIKSDDIILVGATVILDHTTTLFRQCKLIQLAPLQEQDMEALIESALHTHPRGFNRKDLSITPEAVLKLKSKAKGNARFLLNTLEKSVKALGKDTEITAEKISEDLSNKSKFNDHNKAP